MSMTPHDNTKSPQEPSRGKAATEWGYFYILGEVIGFLLLLFVGVRFLVSAERSDVGRLGAPGHRRANIGRCWPPDSSGEADNPSGRKVRGSPRREVTGR